MRKLMLKHLILSSFQQNKLVDTIYIYMHVQYQQKRITIRDEIIL